MKNLVNIDLRDIRWVLKEYMSYSGKTKTALNKEQLLSRKTIDKIFSCDYGNINKETIKKILNLPNLQKEFKPHLMKYLSNKLETKTEKIAKIEFEKLKIEIKNEIEELKKDLFSTITTKKIHAKERESSFSLNLRVAEIQNPIMREASIKNKLVKMHEEVEKNFSSIDFLVRTSQIGDLKNIRSALIVTIERFQKFIFQFQSIIEILDKEKNNSIEINY
ncbi:MAG: hypothetical protein ACRCSK_07860 [Fusobacteriaceae bacterium]